ncbi:(2Fe-2S)-binding protein [Bordetella bronchialis]|uniref:Aldehyde dehydrogenase n=1 Tax=Bordetella bronchialis TaxID=463025 RepID=A0ABN4R1C3_9BORD|nr:(2Fe-2S)-binding protein [Bordetella bronchialis]ANN67079.1 aldehyde dehydrogenase [Bordetella bronchialis]
MNRETLNAPPATASAPADTVGTIALNLTVNGEAVALTVDPRISLLDVLRERLHKTGAKKGCNQGACGACTVLVDGRRIVSCLAMAALHEGAHVTTIEGLARDGVLHPLQRAFIDRDAFQCGYCTAGQILSGVACIAEGHARTPEDIQFWMSGNICRCAAYPGINQAVADAAKETRP